MTNRGRRGCGGEVATRLDSGGPRLATTTICVRVPACTRDTYRVAQRHTMPTPR